MQAFSPSSTRSLAESEAAKALRTYYGDELRVPIDPVSIARSLGINTYSSRLENEMSGAIVKLEPYSEIDMFINREHSPVRQRFTAAHELGHYFKIRLEPDADDRTFIHKRDELSSCGTDEDEIFANQFAAALLMPADEFTALRRSGYDDLQLARTFNVSLQAASNRIVNLNLQSV